MEQSALKKYITNKDSKSIPNVLVFVQYEPALVSQYINSLSKLLELQIDYFPSADSVINYVNSGIYDDKLFVIFDDGKFVKNQLYFPALNGLEKRIIVCVNDFDNKSAAYKQCSNNCVVFNKIPIDKLVAYTEGKLTRAGLTGFTHNHIETLVRACDGYLGCLDNEIGKIIELGKNGVPYLINHGYVNIAKPTTIELANAFVECGNNVVELSQRINDNEVVTLLIYMYNIVRSRFISKGLIEDKNKLMAIIRTYNDVIEGTLKAEVALQTYILRVKGALQC